MSQVLTVPTHFTDLGELSEGFLDRVEEDTLILYGPVAYEDGSDIEFSILLADGSPVLEGTGRVRAAVDGGEDRVPETRYDVVVEALEFAGMYEVVFERLVIERQAVSEPPADPAEEISTGETSAVTATDELEVEADEEQLEVASDDEDEPEIETAELSDDEVFSLAPSEEEEDDEPEMTLEASSEDDSHEEEEYGEPEDAYSEAYDAAYASADVDADAGTDADAGAYTGADADTDTDTDTDTDAGADTDTVAGAGADTGAGADADADADAGADAGADTDAETETVILAGAEIDPAYAFEHGIAAEPQVGMPVPIPSMAAPPEAPPAPPTLRLAESPEGLTRPSMGQPEEPLFTDDEVSDVHATGLFAYEDGLPIPSRPPKPDPNTPQQVGTVEAANDFDVERSEPPEAHDDEDEYEEVRLSDFAEEG